MLLDAASFIYFYKFIASPVTRVQYLPRADLGQTCPDMTTRAHTHTHAQFVAGLKYFACTSMSWVPVIDLKIFPVVTGFAVPPPS